MANVDAPFGFRPIGTLSGSPWQDSVRQYHLNGTVNTLAIAVGDLVTMAATGYPNLYAAGNTQCLGVCVGVLNHVAVDVGGKQGDSFLSTGDVTQSGINAKSVPASTAGIILVATAPDLIMVGQEDGDTDPLELADVGQNVEIIGGGPNANTGISDMEIDSSTHNTTNTLPLRILGLSQDPDTELGDTASVASRPVNANWLVTFANHSFSGLNVGI